MRTPASAVHYGSMVLHNFLATARRAPGQCARAQYIIEHPDKAACFGRRVANEAQLQARPLTHRDINLLLSEPI